MVFSDGLFVLAFRGHFSIFRWFVISCKLCRCEMTLLWETIVYDLRGTDFSFCISQQIPVKRMIILAFSKSRVFLLKLPRLSCSKHLDKVAMMMHDIIGKLFFFSLPRFEALGGHGEYHNVDVVKIRTEDLFLLYDNFSPQ